ncbi:MAG TPA: hypothetical protein VI653_05995 [Steroidobacteraceae bacterium]
MASMTKNAADQQATAASAGTGAFMLTLCRLEAPISIRPPQNPQLAQFKFFMSRSPHTDGSHRLHLHMGYFPTLADAEKWLHIMRPRYPTAIATRTPPVVARRPAQPAAEPPVVHGIPPSEAGALTDTQVLQILETRVQPSPPGKRPLPRPEISLLRPDDTNARRALKEAVIKGAPISFVVQLCRSSEPLELSSMPSLDIFRAYTLYLAEGVFEGTPWHALRMGFFGDADSAKQVAYYARTSFASVAVVPINDDERTRAGQHPVALTLLARKTFDRSIDEMLAADQAESAAPGKPRYSSAQPSSGPNHPATTPDRATTPPVKARQKDGLEQTEELLPASEIWAKT